MTPGEGGGEEEGNSFGGKIVDRCTNSGSEQASKIKKLNQRKCTRVKKKKTVTWREGHVGVPQCNVPQRNETYKENTNIQGFFLNLR